MKVKKMIFKKIELLSQEQVAEILGVKVSTLAVWRSTQRYDLPYVKCGGRVRYRLSDVEAFLSARTYLEDK